METDDPRRESHECDSGAKWPKPVDIVGCAAQCNHYVTVTNRTANPALLFF